jgi:hypothetical protein
MFLFLSKVAGRGEGVFLENGEFQISDSKFKIPDSRFKFGGMNWKAVIGW